MSRTGRKKKWMDPKMARATMTIVWIWINGVFGGVFQGCLHRGDCREWEL